MDENLEQAVAETWPGISEAKLAANRANAQLSTGPRTPEGKQASKSNALRHGLASVNAVLPSEDPEEYNRLLQAFVADHSPVGVTEEAIVKQIADATWKLRRLSAIEGSVFQQMLTPPVKARLMPALPSSDPYKAIAENLLAPGKGQSALNMLARYQATLNRQFLLALKELRTVQDRRKAEQIAKQNEATRQARKNNPLERFKAAVELHHEMQAQIDSHPALAMTAQAIAAEIRATSTQTA